MSNTNGNGAGSAILAAIAALEAKVDRLMAHLGANRSDTPGAGTGGSIATVAQIQGEHGDPKIGKMPRNWDGPSFEGCVASECSPEFLDFYAEFLDWKAENPRPGKEKFAKYDALNGARCRRWAVEIREGRVKQTPQNRAAALLPPGDFTETVWDGPPEGEGQLPGGDLPPFPGDDDQPF